ncbi:sensor histidine kinase [Fundidesulfovibrio putealis]|uniref:sensor histidine kinase n=1 Tax=Fundidesulfovibrio putealis TaxID=270496 RepID=UPI00040FBEBA|nr:histidine kinase dimerization/phosphoacceptor domain -containing protein [Fundidesulfovibrio putealis]
MAVVLGNGWERRQHELEHAKQTTLRLAEYYAHLHEIEVDRIEGVLRTLAKNQVVLNMNSTLCSSLFRDYLGANPHYVNFALMDGHGDAVASALHFTKQNLSDRKEFQDALRDGSFSVGKYSIGKVSGVQVLPFAYPVTGGGGQVSGVLVATLRLQDMATAFELAHLPTDSYVGLVDARGRRLYRYPALDTAPVGSPVAQAVWDRIQSVDREQIFTAAGGDGVRRVYAVRRVALAGGKPYLNIVLTIPEGVILAQADEITRNYLWWLAASLLFSIGLAVLVGKYGILSRVNLLVKVARRLGAGELSARTGISTAKGSLGLLASAMDTMAQALECDRAELVHARAARDKEILRHSALMDLSGDGIVVIDTEHRIVEANRRFCEMLGRSLEEVIGLYIWEYESMMNEADIRSSFMFPEEVCAVFETCHRRKDGTMLPVEVNAVGKRIWGESLIICVVRDISERKKSEEARRQSLNMMQTIMDAIPADIYVMDPASYEILFMNKGMQRRFRSDLTGTVCWRALRGRSSPCPDCTLSKLLGEDAKPNSIWEEYDTVTGRSYVNCDTLITWTDNRRVMLQVATEVTELKEAELLIQRSLEEKTVLLMEIHHRVKNNLQIISSLISLQEMGVTHPVASRALKDCQGRILSMAQIHEQLYQSQDFTGINIESYARTLLTRVCSSVESEVPVDVVVDSDDIKLSLEQAIPLGLILNELATNAMKHAFKGRSHGQMIVSAKIDNGMVKVVVEDDGIGMRGGMASDAFGSLGLQIVSALSNQLGGSLSCKSNDGTRFMVDFPLKPCRALQVDKSMAMIAVESM